MGERMKPSAALKVNGRLEDQEVSTYIKCQLTKEVKLIVNSQRAWRAGFDGNHG